MTREQKLENALLVIVLNPLHYSYLQHWDPKALEQIRHALGPCKECGQGPLHESASEHKSFCSYWVSDEPFHDLA